MRDTIDGINEAAWDRAMRKESPMKDPEETSAKKKLEALKPLIEKFRQQQAASYETLEDIMQAVGGNVSLAAQFKQIEGTFQTAWSARYNGAYVWNYGKDRAQLKRLLRHLSVEEIEGSIVRYLRNSDAFFVKSRHPFALFASTINQHAAPAKDTDDYEFAPMGCTHQPPCKNDEAHTRRTNDERRAF